MIDLMMVLWSQEILTKGWRGMYSDEIISSWLDFGIDMSDEVVEHGYDIDILSIQRGTYAICDYEYCLEWM